ncbi:MAG: GNAT family N-acetyltransferase [Patescibacteria group bacterium]
MKRTSLSLRRVRLSDERYFSRWWRDPRLIHLTSGDHRPLSATDVHRLFGQLAHSRRARHWMVIEGKQPIGHVTVRGHDPAEIQIMIGRPNLWGHGYGTTIATQLRVRIQKLGIKRARMFVWRRNKRSIALGKKFGFHLTGRVRRQAGSRTRVYLMPDRGRASI